MTSPARFPSRLHLGTATLAITGSLSLAACNEPGAGPDDAGVEPPASGEDLRAVVLADRPPPALTGASLTVIGESTVVVTDPDRDLVHVVGVAEESTVHLPDGAQPWRAVADHHGRVHVALRGTGAVATLDVERAELLAIRAVCPTLRGIGLRTGAPDRVGDPTHDRLVLACASGEVVSLSADPADEAREVIARLDPDLRDVLVDANGRLSITRFRSAEVLALGDDGTVTSRVAPLPWQHGLDELDVGPGTGARMRTSTAWRTLAQPDGGWLMVHQGGSAEPIDPTDDGGEGTDDGGGAPAGGYGGGGGGGDTCGAVVQGVLTLMDADGRQRSSGGLSGALLPVDLALHPGGEHVAVAVAGTCGIECVLPQVLVVPLSSLNTGAGLVHRPCNRPSALDFAESGAQIVAVAYTPAGRLWALQREPSVIHLLDGERVQSVVLSDRSVEDTGHRMFHEAGRAGLACASCHPEGGDDGLVWNLPAPRHTPALYVGLAGTAPYHWNGEFADFGALVHDVHEGRMGGLLQSPERIAAFESWVTQLRTAAPTNEGDGEAASGRALFATYGCTSCHGGASTTNNQTVAVGGLPAMQVPSLHAVALHPPYMHDGRSATLTDAVREMIVASRPEATPSAADLAALVAYLETL